MSDEQEAVGEWKVVLTVVMVGDPSSLDSDEAQQELTAAMTIMMDNVRRRFPGRVSDAMITDLAFHTEERHI